MSEGFAAPPPPAPPGRTRPATVTAAGAMILLVIVASAVYLVASIMVLGAATDAFNEALAGTDFEDAGALFAATTLLSGVVYLLIALALGILTIFNNQGRNGARIATWVVGGVGVCCGGLALLGSAFSGFETAGMPQDQNMPDAEEIERILTEHIPAWFEPVTIASNVVGVLVLAGALILLALPPSNEFFRKPGAPGAPGAPGQPPEPQYPQVG